MKKIVVFISNLEIGGIQKYISDLTNILKDNYNVDIIITNKTNKNPSYYINNKINIKYLIDNNYDDLNRYKREKNYIKLLLIKFNIIKNKLLKNQVVKNAIKNIKCDYIITNDIYESNMINKYLSIKAKKIMINNTYPDNNYKKNVIKIMDSFDKLVVCSNVLYDIYKDSIKNKVVYIPYYIDNKISIKTKLDNKNIVTICNFSKEERLDELLNIMSLIVEKDRDINLIIIGDGTLKERNNLIKKIKDFNLNNNIQLTGNINNLEVERLLLNSSMYTITSCEDTLSISLLEAMNLGLPIISYYNKNKLLNGSILIEKKDKQKYADTITYFFNNKKDLKQYSKNSINNVKNYSKEKCEDSWNNLLKDINKRKKTA